MSLCGQCAEHEAEAPICELCQLLNLSVALFSYTGVLHTVTPRARIVGNRDRVTLPVTVSLTPELVQQRLL